MFETKEESTRLSAIRAEMMHAHGWPSARKVIENLRGLIRAAVIDEDDFGIGIIRGQDKF